MLFIKVIIPFMVDSKKNIPLSKNKRYEKAHKQCY
ncbi:MAG: hypothetical protein HJHJAOHD_02102 [Flavobacteriales bacterium]|nr:hypothetical protein [Flavobacteriales bacterium]